MNMDIRPAMFVREVGPGEAEDDLVNEARAHTWTIGVEVALVTTSDGKRMFVSGGRDGITFEVIEMTEEIPINVLLINRPGSWSMVARIDWHTHPFATGPSDGDREALRLLGQSESKVIEIGGERDGTSFGPDREKPAGG
jgi:hypothetical protein